MDSIHNQLKRLTARPRNSEAVKDWADGFGSPEFKEAPPEEPPLLRPFDAFIQKLEVNMTASEKTFGDLTNAIHNLEASTDLTPAEAREVHALYAALGMTLTALATFNNLVYECKENARRENAKAYATDPRIVPLGEEEH